MHKGTLPSVNKPTPSVVVRATAVTACHSICASALVHLQASPPFHMLAVSDPIPLLSSSHPIYSQWTTISFPMSLDLIPETRQVLVGYGSGDKSSRVRLMALEDVLALFPRVATSFGTKDIHHAQMHGPRHQPMGGLVHKRGGRVQ